MGDEPIILQQTFKEKLLFYTTAFFVLLAVFSLFGFLFLVPFVIEPAFTTIFMEFDETPAECVTAEVEHFKGASNCSWTSCREGCTKEVYECTQIRVNYKVFDVIDGENDTLSYDDEEEEADDGADGAGAERAPSIESGSKTSAKMFNTMYQQLPPPHKQLYYHQPYQHYRQSYQHYRHRTERGIREYDYVDSYDHLHRDSSYKSADLEFMEYSEATDQEVTNTNENASEWFFTGAKLFPNVKGCGEFFSFLFNFVFRLHCVRNIYIVIWFTLKSKPNIDRLPTDAELQHMDEKVHKDRLEFLVLLFARRSRLGD